MYVHEIEGAGTLVVNRHGTDPEGRATFGWYVYDANGDMLGGAADLSSGVGFEPTEREMVATLAGFLGAAAESYGYAMRNRTELSATENGDLFPPALTEWAYQNEDELSLLVCEIEDPES